MLRRTPRSEGTSGDLEEHAVSAGETEGTLFVSEGGDSTPWWTEFLVGVTEPPARYLTRGVSAVLVLEAADRRFAIAFGNGRRLLDPEAYERDFGLLCALNAVDPERLRRTEARTFDDYALHTLKQLSRLSTIGSFELNTDRELVVSLAGQLDDPELGRRIDGRDAARVTVDVDPAALRGKCAELLAVSTRHDYREHFPFFDKVKRVRDPEEKRRLERLALSSLARQEFERFDLYPPQLVGDEVVAFQIHSPRTRGAPTIVFEPDHRVLSGSIKGLQTLEKIRAQLDRFKLKGIDADGQVVDEWSYFRCLHWEHTDGDGVYVLDGGEWYRVAESFVAEVEDLASDLKPSGIRWPPAKTGQREDDYNAVAAEELDVALLDKRLIRLADQSPIEACDLFTAKRQFIHVKHRKGGSEPLGHLFGQAVVSAESFVLEQQFRDRLKEVLVDVKSELADLVPDRVSAREWGIVLALIVTGRGSGDGAANLPFFSKVVLRLAVRRLRAMGFEVFLDTVGTEVALPTGLPVGPPRKPRRPKAATRGVTAAKRA